MTPVDAQFPAKLNFLFEPHRYKVAWGGRGGAKSWNFARALLIEGTRRKLRIPCGRETQKSIADSVHRLLSDQIALLNLGELYQVEKARIRGWNGTEFSFHGLKHNVQEIKSLEGADIFWVEEAQAVSKSSWDVLLPTIRKEGSEIWISFNPDLETDETYVRWVLNPPADARVVKIGYQDNPWFPEVLRREMEHDRKDPDKFSHIWEGCCINIVAGAIYANELRAADVEGRITRVPYDATRPVHTSWDLGWADMVSIWFFQVFPFEYRLIDYLEGSREPLNYYLKKLQERPYVYGTHYLPHDARAKNLGTGKSVEELMREAAIKLEIVPMLSVADGINAVRTVFPQCYFDANKCADGLQALRHYRYGEIKTLGTPTREPLHDDYSHCADSLRYFAVGVKMPKKKKEQSHGRKPMVSTWG